MEFSCGGCDATWTGVNTSHCSGCHRTFSGPTLFDKHRQSTVPQRVWVKYLDSEGEIPGGKVVGTFINPKRFNKDGSADERAQYMSALRTYKGRMRVNEANGADVWMIETRDVQLPRGRCLDPERVTRPISDVERELGAVSPFDDGRVDEVPVFEFYGSVGTQIRGGVEIEVRRAELWRSYRLRDANDEIIDRAHWSGSDE